MIIQKGKSLMPSELVSDIILNDLAEGLPAITPSFGSCLAEAAAVCLEDQGHPNGVELQVGGDFHVVFEVQCPHVTAQMRLCWNDHEVTTEHGAYGVAFLVIRRLTEYTVIERSRKGTGFDYWLGFEGEQLPFQNKARLEVSGIRKGSPQVIDSRVKAKIKQVEKSGVLLPFYVIVVEFGQPMSLIVRK